MSLVVITAAEAAARLDDFDTVVDARSPAEYADDHLPGAVNWPVLDDDERREVGTEYKQVSAFDARKRGAALVARRIAEHLEAHVLERPRGWQPLVYCWRGGQRSGTLAWFLDQIGFRTHVLRGGYKAFRALVREQLATRPAALDFVVIAGRTGSGKTRLLQTLAAQGAQVLDLEGLARHRGSVLGGLPSEPQPPQKAFDTALWDALRRLDAARPVFVESESRKIGQLHLPEALIERMRTHGRCAFVNLPDAARVQLLLEEYGFFAGQVDRFCAHLDSLVELRGRQTVVRWQALARAGHWGEVFDELMRQHYDPLYTRSMAHNFAGLSAAHPVELRSADAPALDAAARDLIAWAG
ncbi:MAG TPA: tRNA 2-selenouridine(34) synthase MnmH [Burkholderiaceae bacterium]|nr:tRNA 2-selenouridine(34) synthase MnmH [Burkholderiaceae bacterium]